LNSPKPSTARLVAYLQTKKAEADGGKLRAERLAIERNRTQAISVEFRLWEGNSTWFL
jgi:hypothetical protein